MVGQSHLSIDELHKWWNLETSIGRKIGQANGFLSAFYTFLDSFTEDEKQVLLEQTGTDTYWNNKPQKFDPTLLRLVLVKRFIERNRLSVIKEYLQLNQTGRRLEIAVFLHIAKDLFTNQKLPEDIFTYCKYRKKGSPTTWLKINTSLTSAQLIANIDTKSKRLCNVLFHRLRTHREVRFKLETQELFILLISKPIGVEMIPTEDLALEAQRIAYTTLVLDLVNGKIGYVSKSRREVGEVHRFIKKEIYPDSIFSPRTDVELDDKVLLGKLINVNEHDNGLELMGITFKKIQLPNSPTLRLEGTNNQPISEALEQLKSYWDSEGITSVNSITYLLNGTKIGIYSYDGDDEWGRRTINVNTRGKSITSETELLEKLRNVVGSEIKETKFVVKQLTPLEIVEKFLFDKAISIDPAIPKQADEILVKLLRNKLIVKQKVVTKRRCEDWNCPTYSWVDLICGTCGREMIVIGEGLSIKINEPPLLKSLAHEIELKLTDYEVLRQKIQRSKYKKWVLRLTNKKTNLSTYIVPLLEKRDISFCNSLGREGYGLICVYDSHFSGKKDELEAQGTNCLSLAEVTTNLLLNLEGSQNKLIATIQEAIVLQEQTVLQKIYQRLADSANAIKDKPTGYDEDLFEVDIKNILQALVPNVVRLGSNFKGISVPDGYCGYRIGKERNYRVFGWDAKYSIGLGYRLTTNDYKKQQKYIKWLRENEEPKSLGKLRIYGFVSNFADPVGFNSVIKRLQSIPEKPSDCKIILVEDMLLVKVAEWILGNSNKVLGHGPEISKVFFKWLGSANKRKGLTWIFRVNNDWTKLETLLNSIG